jgi:hypothetical protein
MAKPKQCPLRGWAGCKPRCALYVTTPEFEGCGLYLLCLGTARQSGLVGHGMQ